MFPILHNTTYMGPVPVRQSILKFCLNSVIIFTIFRSILGPANFSHGFKKVFSKGGRVDRWVLFWSGGKVLVIPFTKYIAYNFLQTLCKGPETRTEWRSESVAYKIVLSFLSVTIRVVSSRPIGLHIKLKPFLEQHIINQVSESLNRDWDVSPKKFPAEVGLSGNQTQVCPLNVNHSLSNTVILSQQKHVLVIFDLSGQWPDHQPVSRPGDQIW